MTELKCNCPDPSRMRPEEVVQSKYPCPVHDTPERRAEMAKWLLPAEPRAEFRLISRVNLGR